MAVVHLLGRVRRIDEVRLAIARNQQGWQGQRPVQPFAGQLAKSGFRLFAMAQEHDGFSAGLGLLRAAGRQTAEQTGEQQTHSEDAVRKSRSVHGVSPWGGFAYSVYD